MVYVVLLWFVTTRGPSMERDTVKLKGGVPVKVQVISGAGEPEHTEPDVGVGFEAVGRGLIVTVTGSETILGQLDGVTPKT